MTIPDYQTIMLPLLKVASDGEAHSISEAVEKLARVFQLSEEEQSRLLPSGQQPVLYNRVGWARTHLKKAGLVEDPRRGYFRITNRGRSVLRRNLDRIDNQVLREFPEFVEFLEKKSAATQTPEADDDSEELTPQEALEAAYQRIREDLVDDVLVAVRNSSPGFFEKLVIDLLVKMGYGGSQRDAARAIGRSGDEGIDGVIQEDRLGLDVIYVQAKRWKEDSSVGRPEIQRFVGALHGKRAKKGIFITSTSFTSEADRYADSIETKVVLIDGKRLADLMIDHNVGVALQTNYEIKSVDSDYFGEGKAVG